MSQDPKRLSVLITGAAGGIGSAVSFVYAEPGAHLFLGDVNRDRLDALVTRCRAQGAQVRGTCVDVVDREAMRRWIGGADEESPLNLVIALAGISHGSVCREESPEQIRSVFAVNLEGMLNTIEPILPRFRERRRGHIALTSSEAGCRGFAVAPSYCATKAAIRVYGEGLAARLRREGVRVTVIIPGFVKTPMTDANPYPMPFRVSAEKAARVIRKGLARGQARIRFPWPIAAGMRLLSICPASLVDRFAALR